MELNFLTELKQIPVGYSPNIFLISHYRLYYVYGHLFRTGCYSITACISGSHKSFYSLFYYQL